MKLTKETTDKQISKLDPPVTDTAAYHMDIEVKGFGLRVASGGCKTYVLRYRTKSGAQRCYNIGRHPAWGVKAARMEAKRLKVEIDRGADPHGEDKAVREAPTMRDLCQEYIEQHLSKKRASTQADGKSMLERDILPPSAPRSPRSITGTLRSCTGTSRKAWAESASAMRRDPATARLHIAPIACLHYSAAFSRLRSN